MILWIMVVAQLIVWAWFSIQGGKLADKCFLIFTVGMLLGQIAAGIESYQMHAERSLVIQIYFFGFTLFGGIQRFRKMRNNKIINNK
ncbi:MAG: hypothetical protein HYW78_00955 [Parcubacteria group bacterium]|nr:hypothetical protein [Parcubacteria group bacterium]